MPDIKNDIGAREVEALERRCLLEISYEYGQASREMENKLRYYLQKFAAEDALERQKLEAGQITQKEYGLWRQRKMLLTSGWRNMRDILTEDAVNADMIAASIIKGYMPEAYAIGFNYATYLVEKSGHIDTNFILYDKSTIERLWRKYPKLMPDPAPNSRTAKLLKEQKDMRWNRGHIQSAVTQSILQGESLNETARRLQHVVEMDNNVAKRSAATMLTSAQNGGRQDSYARAEALGVDLLKLWIATIDGSVRNAHRDLDGQTVKQDEPFKSILGDIMFPGDPNADPANVYNCRCTMGTQIKGFESDPADLSVRPHDIGNMTYEEWKAAKGNEAPFKAAQNYNADDAQLEAYKQLGVKGLPSNTRDFQNIKYYDPKAYSEIKEQARALRSGKEYIPVENEQSALTPAKSTTRTTQEQINDINAEIKKWHDFSDNSPNWDDWVKAEEEIKALQERQEALKSAYEHERKENTVSRMKDNGFFDSGEAFVSLYEVDDISADNLETIEKAYSKVFNRYPQLKGRFSGIGAWDSSEPENAAAETDMQGGLISFNPRYWGSGRVSTIAQKNFAANKLSTDTPEGMAMHEIGHAIDSYTKNRWDIAENRAKVYSGNIKTTSENGYFMRKVYHQAGVDKSQIGNFVSLYATENDAEAFAECFAAYMTGSKSNAVIDTFGRLFEELMAGVK